MYDTSNNIALIQSMEYLTGAKPLILNGAGGNVGIGTTDPKAPLSSYTTRAGYPDASGTGSSNVVARIQSGSICLDFGSIGGTNPFWIQNHLSTNNATNYPILLNPNGGNVGIGTTNPGYLLDVSNSTSSTSTSFLGLTNPFVFGFNTGLNIGSSIVYSSRWQGDGGSGVVEMCKIDGRKENSANYGDSYLAFQTRYETDRNNGGAGTLTEKMRITGVGRVGIGTTSPSTTLSIFQNFNDSGTAAASIYDALSFDSSQNANSKAVLCFGSTNSAGGGASGGGVFAIKTRPQSAGGATAPVERFRITDGGNVGIGTASPGYPLHVATSPVSLNGVAFRYFNYTTTVLTQANPGNLGISIYAQGDVVSTTGIVVTSDRRAKVLEEPPTEPYLNLVDKIQVHQYSWIDKIEKSANKKIGFFAQEVEEVVPDAVGKNTDVVPTIYKQADAFTESTITVTNHGLTTEKKLEVVDLENGKTKIDIVRVIDADNLEVKFEKVPKDKLFVVGPEVDDSRLLNHDYLMAVGFGGLKELHALVKSQQTTIEMLTERLAALEGTIGSRVGA
jgi:hypothetical protein